jgi:hypothetical protein
VEPWDLVLAGRVVVLLLSLATVVLVGLLGARICSRAVGILAALIVAVLPAFVTRGSIVTVDTAAACFATAALYCAARVSSARRERQVVTWVVVGGAAAGLAFTSKYLSGSALFAVFVVVTLLRDRSIPRRLMFGAAATGGFVLSAVASMPALLVKPSSVLAAMSRDMHVYGKATSTNSYLYQLASRSEVGVPVLLAGVLGLAVLLSARRARPVAIAYLAFALPTVAVLLQSSFQPARNLLPVVPFLAIAAAALVVDVFELVGKSLRLPRAASLVGATLLLLVFCWPPYARTTRPYLRAQQSNVDTRVTARQWIERHVREGDRVLVAAELAFLPTELRRVCADVDVRSQRREVALDDYDWVVMGDLDPGRWSSPWSEALARRRPVFSVGSFPTSGADLRVPDQDLEDIWHRNQELIHVVRTPRAPSQPARGAACRSDH